ncbi:hypothetical protein [Sandaracinus amylolyticus]|uniref:Uncharacterized protein n=1 Tax=Sandaracinus amylolyticus TaxID=927083 RepID=A0A0F6YG21_9BACT|nr:hypothetical protein [Sandaracinus amylolyticus]AKF04303.1 hypothetical protein DB32_001452 [Sandaracinus amylolyticus]
MRVDSVATHNTSDGGAVILGAFTARYGVGPVAITNGAYHTFVLAVDASGNAQLSIDGSPALTRAGFSVSGTIAIGDQTNDPGVDSTLRIRSVRLLCP